MSPSDEGDLNRLWSKGLPECNSEAEIALVMEMSIEKLRSLAFNYPTSSTTNYHRFQILKKPGESRAISAPMSDLKVAQKWISTRILEKIQVHDAAHGFRRNRSIVTNAKPHVSADIIVKIDLQDFFRSISYQRVKKLFLDVDYSETAARIFGLICTVNETEEIEIDGKINYKTIGKRHLPQGSPASPAISNIICYDLDRRLSQVAQELGFCYTRYADDLTFSGSRDVKSKISKLISETRTLIESEGFTINPNKTQILGTSVQQKVTGVVINKKLNVAKKTLKAFRATLYQIEREGLAGKRWGNSTDIMAAITGFANYVAMVNPNKGVELLTSIKRIEQKYAPPESPRFTIEEEF
ncbi:MAG: reverse transcriptase family protein [Cyanosarcina radialis HA8281-LM2]|jgi:retron-type reverse transcriptase|nr:reverse transcriptase family protein [Cyanosarcina radialis HA8281-LM2]